MIRLPHNFEGTIERGIAALRAVEAEWSNQARERPEPGRLLLDLRDIRGLADRLAAATLEEWQHGWGRWYNGQDLAVLRELAAQWTKDVVGSVEEEKRARSAQAASIERLATVLTWWLEQ